jgi:hypothetical protein
MVTVDWVRWIDGSDNDQGRGIAIDSSSNIYIAGLASSIITFFGDVSFSKPNPATDSAAYVAKFNASGTIQWVQWIDGTSTDQGFAITVDASNNVYTCGYVSTGTVTISGVSISKPSGNNQGGFLVKYNTNGVYQWVQWVDGTGNERLEGVDTDANGNVYVTGWGSSGTIVINGVGQSRPSTANAALIVKYTSAGVFQWVQWIDGTGSDQGFNVATDPSGNIYGSGFVSTGTVNIGGSLYTKPSNANNAGAFVVKYNTTGLLQWVQWIDGSGTDEGRGITSDYMGNVYVTGIVSTPTVNISGQIYSKPSASTDQGIFIVKYNTNGALQWVQWIDGSGNDQARGVSTDASGNLYATGFVTGGIITIGNKTYTTPYPITQSAYVSVFNPSGQLVWLDWIDSSGNDQGYDIIPDSIGNIYATGVAASNVIIIGDISYTKTYANNGGYIIKYKRPALIQPIPDFIKLTTNTAFSITPISNSNGAFSYFSSAPAVATVDTSGTITPLTTGLTTITVSQAATATYGESTTTFDVSVNLTATIIQPISNITKFALDPSFSITPISNSDAVFIFSSSAPAVAAIDASGSITILSVGLTTITVSQAATPVYTSAFIVFTITVNLIPTVIQPITNISKFIMDDPIIIDPSSNSDSVFVFSSSAPAVAAIDASGVITFLTAGTTTITVSQAATAIYTDTSEAFTVTVSLIETIIQPIPDITRLVVASPFVIKVTSNSTGALTFSSSAPSIASINSAGLITPYSIGTTTITIFQTATEVYSETSIEFAVTLILQPVTVSAAYATGGRYRDSSFLVMKYAAAAAAYKPERGNQQSQCCIKPSTTAVSVASDNKSYTNDHLVMAKVGCKICGN